MTSGLQPETVLYHEVTSITSQTGTSIYFCLHEGIFSELISGEQPVLVDFTAAWCGPCKMLAPILEEVAGKLGNDVRIIKIDVDQNPAVAGRYQIRGVPTLILFRRGENLWRQSGVQSAHALEQAIRGVLV